METHLRYLLMWSEQTRLQCGTTYRSAPGEIPHLPSGGLRHLSRDPKVWSAPLSRCNWDRVQTTAETAGLHTPESCSMQHRSPLASPPEALPCWIEDFVCPAAHLALEILLCKILTTPLPTCLPDLQPESLGLGWLFPTDCSVCVIFLLDC